MKLLHLLHVWIEGAWRDFQLATINPLAPAEHVQKLMRRQIILADKSRRLEC